VARGALAQSDEQQTWDELLAIDRRHVWHPYAPMPSTTTPLPVVSARGVRLRLADGREVVDAMASWWCAIHGYGHPVLDAAVGDQLARMAHVMFGGLTHEGAVRLAERLVAMTPDGLEHVFFADSGSVSVEVALKMCLQFWQASGRPGRRRFLTVRGGYHGDTFGAMAVCDPVNGMHGLFRGVLPEHVFAPQPPDGFARSLDERWAGEVAALVEQHADEVAAIRWSRGPEACASTLRRASPGCASCATATTCCSSWTRSPRASGAPARSSPASTPRWRRT
jgi:adenosylmethionine---8-amino-7-oxononanoate aminotransferase